MSLIGRPSSPPFALIPSAQICLDIRWALPEEASPPVSDTPKPILIGSCACAEKNAPDNAIAAAATTSSDIRGRAFSAILILYPLIASSPGASIEPTQRAFDANDTSDLLSARKPRCEMGRRPPLQRAASCVGAALQNNIFCILAGLLRSGGIRSLLGSASRPATRRLSGIPVPLVLRARC